MAVAAATAVLAPTAASASTINTDKSFVLESNTTREIVVPINGLGQAQNVLEPCYGFEISGPGVDLAGANLEFFGPVASDDQELINAGLGVQQQADGSYARPESVAVLTAEVLRMGANCRSVGWDFTGPDGEPQLDPYGNPKTSNLARAASKRKRTAARKRMSKKIVGHAAQAGPVSVTLAGLRHGELVLRVTTGQLNGTTTVTTHTRVLRQG
jgi:hypothetical protein